MPSGCCARSPADLGAHRRVHCRGQGRAFCGQLQGDLFPAGGGRNRVLRFPQEPYDKAGAYAIQGRAALWLDRIEGDYYTIVGLPVSRTDTDTTFFCEEKMEK